MADITIMCKGQKDGIECPLRENCYRYKAKSNNLWQSYFTDIEDITKNLRTYKNKDSKFECSQYWDNKKR